MNELKSLDPNPFKQFKIWYQDAIEAKIAVPHAMTLATASKEGIPSARMVLLKDVDEGGFVFYTNYESQKGQELAKNPHAALVLYWKELDRQVRITGEVSKVSRQNSQAYFQSRPIGSQLGAWASNQSQVIANRDVLERELAKVTAQYQDKEIPLPPYWGGYRVSPKTIEFWQSGPYRLHNRFRYTRQDDDNWQIERLAP
jgi:pyridoxamine 5'-phosphate oxidase